MLGRQWCRGCRVLSQDHATCLHAEKEMQAAHYRVTMEADGSKRLCTFGFQSGGLDYPAKILELDEAGKQVCNCGFAFLKARVAHRPQQLPSWAPMATHSRHYNNQQSAAPGGCCGLCLGLHFARTPCELT
jgi:hypothetical protein